MIQCYFRLFLYLMCEVPCYQQVILYEPYISLSLPEAAGAAVLFSSLAMATPVICRWFIWQWSREHLAWLS